MKYSLTNNERFRVYSGESYVDVFDMLTNADLINYYDMTDPADFSGLTTQLKQYFVRKPVVLYETDGTTGLLGVNASSLGTSWQLENYDFSPYKYLRCYFKVSDYKQSSNYLTPALIVELPLDSASLAKSDNSTVGQSTPCDMYLGGGGVTNPNDRNVSFNVIVAVDSTKTKFQVVSEHSIYGTAQGDRNTDGRYLYKIEGCFDTLSSDPEDDFVEHDPIFVSSPAYGITSQNIADWNSKQDELSAGTNIKTVNNETLLGSGNVDAKEVVVGKHDNGEFYELSGYTTGLGPKTPLYSSVAETASDYKLYFDIPSKQIYKYFSKKTVGVGDSRYEAINLGKTQEVTGTPAASVTIDPYKMYDFGTVSTAMTIAFNTSKEVTGYTKEYMIRFVAGNGCSITLPSTVLYANGQTPTYTSGKTYELDVVDGCVVVGEFY